MKICFIYLYDLIILSDSIDQQLERLDLVLTRLHEFSLKLLPENCFFMKKRSNFLGDTVSDLGVETDPENTEKILVKY